MLTIPQAVIVRRANVPRVAAQSAGIGFDLEEHLLKLAVRFGPRPPGVPCPAAVFAVPHGSHVLVVQVADLTAAPDDADPPLGFRVLVLDRRSYPGDPFAVTDQFPPDWAASRTLPELAWEPTPLPRRTVEQVRAILKDESPGGPLLLGATQALIDGGHVAVQRDAPDPGFVRGVWQLLPDRVRAELWPATFAFSAAPGFNLVVLPTPPPAGYLGEEQAKDYPESRYELALQSAAESGDQAELDRLFARKTSQEVLRLAVAMVVFALVIAAVMKFL